MTTDINSSLNVFDDGAVLLGSVIWSLSIALMFFKLLCFKGWFFHRHQVKSTLLGPVDRASLYRWTLSTKHAGHTSQLCEDLTMSYKVRSNTKIIQPLLQRKKRCGLKHIRVRPDWEASERATKKDRTYVLLSKRPY
jgi:hypothetical protein